MSPDLVKILDGNTFVVSDRTGDVDAAADAKTGLFSFDTRFLSRWRLTINGQQLNPLSVDDLQYYETRFFLVPGAPTHYVDADLSVIRHRSIGGGFEEQLTVLNHSPEPAEIDVRVTAASDFASLQDILTGAEKKGSYYTRIDPRCLRLGYQRERLRREAVISASEPTQVDEGGFTFSITVPAHQDWTVRFQVNTRALGRDDMDLRAQLTGVHTRTRAEIKQDLDDWLDRAPKLECAWQPLAKSYERGLVDLASLRYNPLTFPDNSLPAAGLPWYMAITGRDSLISSLQTLPFAPDLAATTLRMLGVDQGGKLDDFRDEEPGKILREFRYSEQVAFEEMPQSPYYGSADTTPLYVILMDEYERWTGDVDLVREFEPETRAALAWIDEYGDVLGNGYLSYQRRNERTGIENQCWKESSDSISFRDGRLPMLPRATCELQGYAYDAKRRGARLAREIWGDPALADRLEREAAELKERFNRDFWIDRHEFYALALDGEGRQVDALASNMGHLLWSGIVPESRAPKVVEHLMGPALFSGWGIRSLATTAARYNPIGYHVGTVWPFDNSLIAWGLRQYGFPAEAARIAHSSFEASDFFQGRLPETFGGYDRSLTRQPVQYSTACSPHAWSTGATFLLIRTLLGLEPLSGHLVADPALPTSIGRVDLLDIPGRWGHADALGRGRIDLTGRW